MRLNKTNLSGFKARFKPLLINAITQSILLEINRYKNLGNRICFVSREY